MLHFEGFSHAFSSLNYSKYGKNFLESQCCIGFENNKVHICSKKYHFKQHKIIFMIMIINFEIANNNYKQ